MIDQLLQLLSGIPEELQIMVLAMLPVTELRASIPIGILGFHMEPIHAYIWSVIGNLIPVFVILKFFPGFIEHAKKRYPKLNNVLEKYFQHLKKKYAKRYNKYGAGLLVLFVAIPLPGSGAWTASVVAVLFGIKHKYSIAAISLGVMFSGLILLSLFQL